VRRRAELYYQQLDALELLRQQARRDLLAESRKHSATKLLRQIPLIGPIRAALLIALIQTPHRFRTKRQLWAYSGLATLVSFGSRFGPSRLQDHLGGGSQWHRFAQRSQTGIARPSRGGWMPRHVLPTLDRGRSISLDIPIYRTFR
jgi:hypothetical protein